MTVDTHHLNLFPSQLQPNRNMYMNSTDTNLMNIYNYSSENVIPTTLTPSYNNHFVGDNLRQKITDMISDSNSNSNRNIVSYPLKRSRDWSNNYHHHYQNTDIDIIISQHMEKVRMELEEKRKRETMMIIEAIEVQMMKKVKDKEEEISKIGRMNMMLEERVKTLMVENQIWRELAQNNEATANALRSNLEQVLREMKNNGGGGGGEEDAESCCENEWRTVVSCAQDKEDAGSSSCWKKKRWCRNCGERESCVLILPCRHLCLCDMCGATVDTCPICLSFKNTTLNVNFS